MTNVVNNGSSLVARFSAEFVDLERILRGVEPLAKTMKTFFNHPEGGYTIILEKGKQVNI